MEQVLLQLQQQRSNDADDPNLQFSPTNLYQQASLDFMEALLNASKQQAELSHQEETLERGETVSLQWLLDLCSKASSSNLLGGPTQLAIQIVRAANLSDENQQQAALFDALGEDGMDIMFEIVPYLLDIRTYIPESSIQHDTTTDHAHGETLFDPEEQLRERLLQEAQDASHVANLTRMEADAMFHQSNSASATHTVMRTKDLRKAQNDAKKAAKRAASAWTAAREAGVVDEQELYLQAPAQEGFGSGGLMNRTREELQSMQMSLAPQGTKQYHEEKGLPAGTERETTNGCEIVTIPAPSREALDLPPRLLIDDVLDSASARKAFSGTTSLNPMQSKTFEIAYNSRENMLVCAPTGAGKTNVAMLTVVAHLRNVGLLSDTSSQDRVDTGKKIVYIAPMKALAQEVVSKFSSKLNPLGFIVKELTGDMQLTRAEADAAHVLVTTPEKWDVVTRKSSNDDNSLGNSCGLLIIDEVHLLADERGAVIESVVARLHRLVESRQRQVRIVGLSATLPNYKDVAEFLQVQPNRGLFYFGPEYRPVPLQQQFIGCITHSNDRYVKENKMNDVCYDIVVDSLRRGHQVLVFVHSRKGTGDTATALTERAQHSEELESIFCTQGKEGAAGDAYKRYVDRVRKSRNREVGLHFENGFGIHHAGMLRGDRKLSEQLFSDGAIKVLCCTATLAWGVNLPCHSVVIKGTDVYNPEKGGNVDLSILDVQQIFGRAGRPQFDTSGEATLITNHKALARYLDKLVRAVPIESNFIKQLPDHLNAEIVGGTVANIREAATWLTYTYLHVRMLRNPLAYGISADQKDDDPRLRGRSMELVEEAAKILDSNRMIQYDPTSGNLVFKDLGRVAAHFYLQAESVATFNEMLGNQDDPTDVELCHTICCATEFENVRIRQEELKDLDGLAENACPLPVKPPIHESSDKCLVLMQAFISRFPIRSFTLISDTNYIASNGGRVARAMFEMTLMKSCARPALKLLRIAKSIDKRLWWFQSPLRQFEGELRHNVYNALESRKVGSNSGDNAFESTLALLDMRPSEVGHLCHWSKGGDKVQSLVKMLPRVEVECMVKPITKSIVKLHVTLTPIFDWHGRWHGGAESFWLWVEDDSNDRIFRHEHVVFSRRTHPEPVALELVVPLFNDLPSQYFIRLVSDSWVGVETVTPVSFRDVQVPSQPTPFTDLLDLTPLPTTALQQPMYEQLYRFDTFNPIQTQLFHVLYHTDSPVLLGAPTGSGKTIVAELALLRMKRMHPKGICVYIAPLKSLARERLREWRRSLGSPPLRWTVLELSGDTHHDRNALNKADVLVCTPEKWDLISRGWQRRKDTGSGSKLTNGRAFVKRIRLLVIDEIHLLGEERGAVLEAIVSRTRFISRHIENQNEAEESGATTASTRDGSHEVTRIVGLSTALANPFDLADWIGIETTTGNVKSRRGLYNFRPSVRPVPMTIHMRGFPGKHYCPRMATMNKPCYSAIKQHSPSKPVIIFVASRRQTRLTAMDIISYAAADENPRAFLGCPDDYISSIVETLSDEVLRHTTTFGIGLHHAGLSSQDRETVEKLFLNGEIQVLVATATLAWGVNLPASFVIVKGTEYFDSKTSRYVDYPLTDVLQMIGRAGRPQFDTEGVALVMVAEAKKSFYMEFLYSPFPVESCLRERLCENINAEIATGTITSADDAVGYLKWTFFYRRVKENPSFYGAASNSDDDVQKYLRMVVQATTTNLREHGCIRSDDGTNLFSTDLGQTASEFYLDHRSPKQMQFGVQETRQILIQLLLDSEQNVTAVNADSPGGTSSSTSLMFAREPLVDEACFALLVYYLCMTHEFDEVPVRHNEEYLNLELSKRLPWGSDARYTFSKSNHLKKDDIDAMSDPHTKCFLLTQAHMVRAKLPISDYVNDTRTVIDQLPRLLAAMQDVAQADKHAKGNFELVCQFSRTKQLLQSRSMPDTDPICQIPGISPEALQKSRINGRTKQALSSLNALRSMDRSEAAPVVRGIVKSNKGDVDRALNFLFSIPVVSIQNLAISPAVDEQDGRSNGRLSFTVCFEFGDKYTGGSESTSLFSISAILGSARHRSLLCHQSIAIHRDRKSSSSVKDIIMEFDWTDANNEGGGSVVLRLISETIRGIDTETIVPLT